MWIKQVKFEDIEGAWRRLYRLNDCLSPYSSFDFNKIFYRNYRFGLKRLFLKSKFYEVVDDKEDTIMIIPLFGNKKKYYIFGDLTSTGYLDFIYKSNCSDVDFNEVFKLLRDELKGSTVFLNKINEKSKLNNYLASKYSFKRKDICVNISFGSYYDEYFKTLSKSVRQNIRTSHNRLSRESLSWRIEVEIDQLMSNNLKNNILKVYNKRSMVRDGVKVGILTDLIRRYKNPITISTAQMKGNFNSVLWINDSIAAFLSGYVSNDNRTVIIPRHAIDTQYNKYSPGALIISETIKWLMKNTNIRNLDLSRGSEEYKYKLGGTEHRNYSYEIHV